MYRTREMNFCYAARLNTEYEKKKKICIEENTLTKAAPFHALYAGYKEANWHQHEPTSTFIQPKIAL